MAGFFEKLGATPSPNLLSFEIRDKIAGEILDNLPHDDVEALTRFGGCVLHVRWEVGW